MRQAGCHTSETGRRLEGKTQGVDSWARCWAGGGGDNNSHNHQQKSLTSTHHAELVLVTLFFLVSNSQQEVGLERQIVAHQRCCAKFGSGRVVAPPLVWPRIQIRTAKATIVRRKHFLAPNWRYL